MLNVKVICHHNVYGIEIQIFSAAGHKTNVCVVISRSRNRYVDELRYRESENLPEEVAQEIVQDEDKEHSQGERSEDFFLIHQRVWEDLAANEYSYGYKWETPQVSKFRSSLVLHEHSRERETDGAIHWTFTSPKLMIRFQRNGGSIFTDRKLDQLHLERKQQNKIPVFSEFLQQIAVPSSHSRTHWRRQ